MPVSPHNHIFLYNTSCMEKIKIKGIWFPVPLSILIIYNTGERSSSVLPHQTKPLFNTRHATQLFPFLLFQTKGGI